MFSSYPRQSGPPCKNGCTRYELLAYGVLGTRVCMCKRDGLRQSRPHHWLGAIWFQDLKRADKHLREVQGPGIQGL